MFRGDQFRGEGTGWTAVARRVGMGAATVVVASGVTAEHLRSRCRSASTPHPVCTGACVPRIPFASVVGVLPNWAPDVVGTVTVDESHVQGLVWLQAGPVTASASTPRSVSRGEHNASRYRRRRSDAGAPAIGQRRWAGPGARLLAHGGSAWQAVIAQALYLVADDAARALEARPDEVEGSDDERRRVRKAACRKPARRLGSLESGGAISPISNKGVAGVGAVSSPSRTIGCLGRPARRGCPNRQGLEPGPATAAAGSASRVQQTWPR